MNVAADFVAASRGARGASRTLVVHRARTAAVSPVGPADPSRPAQTAPRVGFVVSKAVGGSVTRNRVKRRLRHLALARLDDLSPGVVVTVRALPASAGASSTELGSDLDRCLERAGALCVPSRPAIGTVTA